MLVWKLCNSLPESSTQDWNNFCLREIGHHISPQKKQTFILSRSALLEAVKEFSPNFSINDLTLVNFHQIKSLSELTLSLSHTKTAGAAVIGERKEYLGLGIDVESSARVPSQAIMKKINTANDFPLSAIQIWCLKEAIYKSMMNSKLIPSSSVVLYSQIIIEKFTWHHKSFNISGEWELHELCDHVVALSIIKN